MNASDDDEEVPPHVRASGSDALRDWRIQQLESTVKKHEREIASEKNWRMLVTGGVGVASAFITWVVTTWGRITH